MKWTVKCSRQMGAGEAKLERSFSDTSRVGQRTVPGTQCSEGEVGFAGSTKTNGSRWFGAGLAQGASDVG